MPICGLGHENHLGCLRKITALEKTPIPAQPLMSSEVTGHLILEGLRRERRLVRNRQD